MTLSNSARTRKYQMKKKYISDGYDEETANTMALQYLNDNGFCPKKEDRPVNKPNLPKPNRVAVERAVNEFTLQSLENLIINQVNIEPTAKYLELWLKVLQFKETKKEEKKINEEDFIKSLVVGLEEDDNATPTN